MMTNRTTNPGRPRIGIYDPSRGMTGPSRYVESILAGIDPEEFEVVIFGDPAGPFGQRPGLHVESVMSGSSPEDDAGGERSNEGRIGRFARGRWRALVPGIARLWGGFGRESYRLSRFFRRRPVDLLHTNWTGCEESPLAARLAGIPRVVGTFHVDSSYDLDRVRSGFGHRALECLSNRCLHRAIAVSDATKTDWVRRTRLPSDRVVVICNGVDPEAFRRRNGTAEARARLGIPGRDGLVIGGVGRLDEMKGFGDLIEAVALLGDDYPGLTLAIAGDGPLRPTLEAKAAALGIADRVRFLGFQRDVHAFLEALDVFVLPSICEAIGYALLEAMAMGLPTIGTRVGGVPEVIVEGTTGSLVAPRQPSALATSLRPLLSSAEVRSRMGQAGRERVIQHFNERETARRTIELYRQELQVRGVAPAGLGTLG